MKTYYNPEGDACWIDMEVEIVAWDRDRYFTFKDSAGNLDADKCWKFSLKRSNKLHNISYGYMDEITQVKRKESAKEIKRRYKKSVTYRVKTTNLDHYKEFSSLRKALNFCKSNKDATFLHACFYYKNGSCTCPLLEKLAGSWYYFAQPSTPVSEKTIAEFCFNS